MARDRNFISYFGIVILFILFYFSSPVYASCENEYILANDLINVLREYCPQDQIEVKSYEGLADYFKTDRNNLGGVTLLEHFTWFQQDPRTEDFIAAGIDD